MDRSTSGSRVLVTRRSFGITTVCGIARFGRAEEKEMRWVVCYSDREPLSAFDPYSMIILDSRYHPPLLELKKPGRQLIGYLSLGEASPDYSYFQQLRSDGLLLNQN